MRLFMHDSSILLSLVCVLRLVVKSLASRRRHWQRLEVMGMHTTCKPLLYLVFNHNFRLRS